jgi:superfamily II DNA or RNA helicase
MPTGGGKGYMIGWYAARIAALGRRLLVVTNRRVIVNQLARECSAAGVGVGIVMGDIERDDTAPIQVASIQTLRSRKYRDVPDADWVIIDEAHREAKAYRELIERFPGKKVLGFTATPIGTGGTKLDIFERIVEPSKNSELIASGSLLRVDPYIAPSEPDLKGMDLKKIGKDQLGKIVQECTVFGDVFAEWQPYSHMQTLAILPSVQFAHGFCQQCRDRGITAKAIDASTSSTERKRAFAEFDDQGVQMLVSVDVLREGFNAPNAQCLINLQPTHQFRVYWQGVGRVKRPHPGQTSAVVIDFAGNLWRHAYHPDEDPPWDEVTTQKTIEDVVSTKAGRKCPKCGSMAVYAIRGINKVKCSDCKHTWDREKMPWVCPSCKKGLAPYQRVRDGKCPNCGAEFSKPVRRLRSADGSIREVKAEELLERRRKKTSSDSDSQKRWKKWVFIAHGWNKKNPTRPQKTMQWVWTMYVADKDGDGSEPPLGKLSMAPKTTDSNDWGKTPSQLFKLR